MKRSDLFEQVKQDFANEFDINVDELGKDFLAISAVLTTYNYSLLIRLNAIKNNTWPGGSDIETLLIVGSDKLGRLPFPAASGIYTCETTATQGTTEISKGTRFKFNDYVYESLDDVNPGDDIQLRALTPGTESLLAIDDILMAEAPLISAQDTIKVKSIDTAPSDSEDIDDYRQDVVNSFTLRPNGGNASDYILWASDVSDIRTVYPYAANGEAGKIKVYCEGVSQFQPGAAKIDEVIEAIKYDSEGVGRVLVDLFDFITDEYIVPVQISDVNIVLNGGNLGQQAQAEQIVKDYLYNIRPYLPTLNKTRDPEKDTISQQGIIKALSDGGITFGSLIIKIKPLGGLETTVTQYKIGDADDPSKYGEIGVLETLTIN